METDYESPPPSNNPILGELEGEEGFTKKNKKKIQHKRVYGKRGKRAILRVAAQRIEGSTSESDEIKEKEKSSQASTRESKKGKERKGKEKEKFVEISSQSSGREGEEVRGTSKITKLPRVTTKPSIVPNRLEKILSSSSARQTSQSSAAKVASSFNNPQPVASTSKIPYSNLNISNQTIVQSSRVRSRSLTLARQQQENLESEVVLQRRSSFSRSKETNKAFPIVPSSTSPVEIYRATTITSPRHLLRSRRDIALSDKSNLPTTTTRDSPRLTDLPPTLPLFKRQYSTRLSLPSSSSSLTKTPTYLLDNNPKPPTSSSSNLKIFKDSSSSSSSNPLPLPPPPPPSSSDLINRSHPPPLLPPTLTSSFSSSSRSHIITSPHRRTSLIPPPLPPRSPSTPATAPPKFKFTTTIFDNSTSFDRFTEPSLHPHHHHHRHHEFNLERKGGGRILGIGIGIEDVVIEGKEGDGMGMESDFVLESFLESDSQIVGEGGEGGEGGGGEESRVNSERFFEGREKDFTIQVEGRDQEGEKELRKIQVEENELAHDEVGDIAVEKGATSEKTIEMEKGIEDQFGDESKSTIRNEMSEEQEITFEIEREEGLKLIPSQSAEEEEKEAGADHLEKNQVETVEEKEEEEKAQSHEFDPPPLEDYSTVESPIRADESDEPSVPPPIREPIYDACHLPPRRPRVRLSSPTPVSKPASDEDDLAFLIRTTATRSSEDDLPPIDPDLSSDEKDFQSAEREIGRGIKSTSGQRGKRIELKEKMRNGRGGGGGYLRIGEGKGGRRLKWKREIVDLERETVDDDVGEEGDDELELKVEEEWREEGGW
ncbi:hypothetical protein JCM3765_007344 [Sporobolomyces pararoseus]